MDRAKIAEIQDHAAQFYQLARCDFGELTLTQLCLRTVGTKPRFEPIRAAGTLARIRDQQFVVIRTGTPKRRARWVLCHELAHWFYQRVGYHGPDIEQRCDALGAAIVAPRPHVVAAREEVGDNPRKLAARLNTTESVAMLRIGEITGRPVAVVRPHGALVRGQDWEWPTLDLDALRKARRLPEVKKTTIRDEPPRVGLAVRRC